MKNSLTLVIFTLFLILQFLSQCFFSDFMFLFSQKKINLWFSAEPTRTSKPFPCCNIIDHEFLNGISDGISLDSFLCFVFKTLSLLFCNVFPLQYPVVHVCSPKFLRSPHKQEESFHNSVFKDFRLLLKYSLSSLTIPYNSKLVLSNS